MENQTVSESKSYSFLRGINFSRIVLYGIALFVQLSLLITCAMSSGYCDIFTVLVPLILVLVDMNMIRSSRNPFSWFLLASLLVSILSVYIAFQTLFTMFFFGLFFPGFLPGMAITIEERIMSILSLGVIFVSFIEIMMLIYLTRPQEEKEVDVFSGNERTYETPWENKTDE